MRGQVVASAGARSFRGETEDSALGISPVHGHACALEPDGDSSAEHDFIARAVLRHVAEEDPALVCANDDGSVAIGRVRAGHHTTALAGATAPAPWQRMQTPRSGRHLESAQALHSGAGLAGSLIGKSVLLIIRRWVNQI